MYKNYLFDLDGTLLPMDMEKFVKLYFSSLCKRCTPVIKIEPDTLIKAMWAGTDAMTKNDNSRTNREVFWETAGKVSGADLEKFDDLFTDYYENEFIVPKDATSFTPYAKKSIDFIKKNGGRLIAATNPIFPFVATNADLNGQEFLPMILNLLQHTKTLVAASRISNILKKSAKSRISSPKTAL